MLFQSDGEPATVRLVSLSEDALVEGDVAGPFTVVTRWAEYDISHVGPVVREALRRMSLGPVSLGNVLRTPDHGQVPRADIEALQRALDMLSGSVVHSLGLHDGQAPMLSVSPLGSAAEFRPAGVPSSRHVRLSRFAVLRRDGREMLLESPHAAFRAELHQSLARQIVALLVDPLPIPEIASAARVPEPVVSDVVSYLVAAGVVLRADPEQRFAEDTDPVLRRWDHHELLFHVRSRSGQSESQLEPPDGSAAAATVTRRLPSGHRYPLYRPELPVAGAESPSLTELLETDHHCPDNSAGTLQAEQLGELLFRSARIRSTGPVHLRSGMSHAGSQRPYFNVACMYELELYLTLARCPDLPRGIYHYDPEEHALTLINSAEADVSAMLDMARIAAGLTRPPPAVLSVTARMERVSWILAGAAYATTLMHFGALQQTLYLTAKALGLSSHAVPADAGDVVGRALDLEWPAEVSIGECVVGTMP